MTKQRQRDATPRPLRAERTNHPTAKAAVLVAAVALAILVLAPASTFGSR